MKRRRIEIGSALCNFIGFAFIKVRIYFKLRLGVKRVNSKSVTEIANVFDYIFNSIKKFFKISILEI